MDAKDKEIKRLRAVIRVLRKMIAELRDYILGMLRDVKK